MPRQQVLKFKESKPEVDVWALAATLYHMLSGAYPRDFPSSAEKWQVVLQSDPVPIRNRNASIPAKLAKVIDHALVEKPDIGFKSALEFKQALEKVM
jgi:serine/threonine-protein kinase